jgi:general secretion pathway protein G
MARRGFTLIELLVVIVIILLLMALLVPTISKALCNAKQGTMAAMLADLTKIAKMYESDCGSYPPSNSAFESSMLARALMKKTARQDSYWEPKEGDVDENFNIINKVWAPDEFVSYRNNRNSTKDVTKDPDVHNKSSLDLWCKDCNKDEKGCNNWQ